MSDKEEVIFDGMPGSTPIEQDDEKLDLNFGLGDEPEVAETEEEPVAETEEEATPSLSKKAAKKPMVPKSRLDEVLAKQRDLEKQLDLMKAAKQEPETAPEEYNFDEKEVEYQNLVLDGEPEKAVALRREIRNAERAQIEYEMAEKMDARYDQTQQMTALQQAANSLEASFPVFDQNHEDYNEEITQEVLDLRDAFIMKGDNSVAALSKAAKYVIRDHDLDIAADPASMGQTVVDEVAKKRKQVSKKIAAASSQPPEISSGEGSNSHGKEAFDFDTMTEEEFDALPAATLKRLRGDIL